MVNGEWRMANGEGRMANESTLLRPDGIRARSRTTQSLVDANWSSWSLCTHSRRPEVIPIHLFMGAKDVTSIGHLQLMISGRFLIQRVRR